MELGEYLPKSALVVKTTEINQPRFPVVDAHNHLGESFGGRLGPAPAQRAAGRAGPLWRAPSGRSGRRLG